jgi:hypothetical protein
LYTKKKESLSGVVADFIDGCRKLLNDRYPEEELGDQIFKQSESRVLQAYRNNGFFTHVFDKNEKILYIGDAAGGTDYFYGQSGQRGMLGAQQIAYAIRAFEKVTSENALHMAGQYYQNMWFHIKDNGSFSRDINVDSLSKSLFPKDLKKLDEAGGVTVNDIARQKFEATCTITSADDYILPRTDRKEKPEVIDKNKQKTNLKTIPDWLRDYVSKRHPGSYPTVSRYLFGPAELQLIKSDEPNQQEMIEMIQDLSKDFPLSKDFTARRADHIGNAQ